MFFKEISTGRVVLATVWNSNGDHPWDAVQELKHPLGPTFPSEGEYVGFYQQGCAPEQADPADACPKCGKLYKDHGRLVFDNATVCPGDWVVTYGGGSSFLGVNPINEDLEALAVSKVEFQKRYEATGD